MTKFEVLATQVIYLSTIVEANSKKEAQKIAMDRDEWRAYQVKKVTHFDTQELEENA